MGDSTILPVYLRVKPKPAGTVKEPFLTIGPAGKDTTQVQVDPPKGSRIKNPETFTFNGVFREACSQIDTYRSAVFPLVENVIQENRDSLFFTMGASGSGKSHTVLGYKQVPGMVHMAIDTLFKSVGQSLANFEDAEEILDKNANRSSSAMEAGLFLDWSKTSSSKLKFASNSMLNETVSLDNDEGKYKYAVYISMVEIYNDRVYNLLDDSDKPRPLIIKTNSTTKKVHLADLQKIFVSDCSEAFRVIEKGLSNRKANATGINDTSSRSHAFIQVELKKIPNDKRRSVVASSLTIVDLAGSERNKMAKTVGTRLTESCAINQSLMLLGQCLQTQRDREHGHSKDKSKVDFSIFRNCKLTQLLLSNAFLPKGGQKTLIMVNIDPYGDYNSAAQILRYAALAREIPLPETRVPSNASISSIESAASSVSWSSLSDSSGTLVDSDGRSFSSASESANEMVNVKRLMERIYQLETIARQATEKAAQIEEEVREEMSNEMERQLQALEQRYLDRIDDDYESSQALTDKKIEILQQSQCASHEKELAMLRAHNQRLQLENEELRSMLEDGKENVENLKPARKRKPTPLLWAREN
uniref:Kinesin-like protein n=1 Tax=Blastobotrys adeninivorans TaxID=409370 RepID=A0A060TE17_BLAAD